MFTRNCGISNLCSCNCTCSIFAVVTESVASLGAVIELSSISAADNAPATTFAPVIALSAIAPTSRVVVLGDKRFNKFLAYSCLTP